MALSSYVTRISAALVLLAILATPAFATTIKVTVTENIPGANCSQIGGSDPSTRKYECTVSSGFGSVMNLFKGMIKYATFITILLGVFMIVVSGIMLSLSGMNSQFKGSAKKLITQVLVGLTLIFMIGFLLNSIAPWVYR